MFAHVLWLLVICDFITFVTMQYNNNEKYLGPSNFILKSLKDCDGVDPVVKLGVSQKKFNRTIKVWDLTIESLDYEIGDNLVLELKGSMKKDGGFKPGAYYMKKTVCSMLDSVVGEIIDDIFAAAEIEKCPIVPGSYLAKDFFFDNQKFQVPQVFGEYRTEINIFKNEVLQSCFIADYDLKEKDD